MDEKQRVTFSLQDLQDIFDDPSLLPMTREYLAGLFVEALAEGMGAVVEEPGVLWGTVEEDGSNA